MPCCSFLVDTAELPSLPPEAESRQSAAVFRSENEPDGLSDAIRQPGYQNGANWPRLRRVDGRTAPVDASNLRQAHLTTTCRRPTNDARRPALKRPSAERPLCSGETRSWEGGVLLWGVIFENLSLT